MGGGVIERSARARSAATSHGGPFHDARDARGPAPFFLFRLIFDTAGERSAHTAMIGRGVARAPGAAGGREHATTICDEDDVTRLACTKTAIAAFSLYGVRALRRRSTAALQPADNIHECAAVTPPARSKSDATTTGCDKKPRQK